MLILGLSDSHDASVTLIENGTVLAAVSEERFTRRKRQQGFPYNCLAYIKGFIPGGKVEKVYVSGKYGRALFRVLDAVYSRGNPCKDIFSFSSCLAYWIENAIANFPVLKQLESNLSLALIKHYLKRTGIGFHSVELLDHHFAHTVSALAGLPSRNYLVVSMDAYGDGTSGLIINVEDEKISRVKRISYKDSVAQVYAYISAYLGFKEGEEGKVMALADYGKNGNARTMFKGIFHLDSGGLTVNQKYKGRRFLRQLRNYSKEDIAFALQKITEEVVVKCIKMCSNKDKKGDLCLSGGLFANIKVNQRLHETGLFNRIFVFPNMGDGGTSFVSALPVTVPQDSAGCIAALSKFNFRGLPHVYLGPEFDNAHIKDILTKNRLEYSQESDIEKKVARLLAGGKVVARFNGRLEYGPRALGNRSILYQATDKTVNEWLNKRLKRDEFMPFAPVTLYELKDSCYVNTTGAEHAAKFMTITFECTEWMRKACPAVVHIDGTARPQLIKEDDNPGYYKILKEYYDITGIPSIINTSFNMHGEPIVCSPQEAVRTFQDAGIDYLAIGTFLVKNTLSL
jgi:carbamoyltransferase